MSISTRSLLALLICSHFANAGQDGSKKPETRIHVLIAYHSVMGHTAALAKAVEEGARRVPGVEVKRLPTSEVKCPHLFAADAVVVGSPVYWSNMSAEVKAFLDRWTHECNILPPAFEMRDKIGAAFVTGGEAASGKEVTLITILAAMLSNRMIVVSDGEALGAAATTGEGKNPISAKDVEQGRRLGERVARVAMQFKQARNVVR